MISQAIYPILVLFIVVHQRSRSRTSYESAYYTTGGQNEVMVFGNTGDTECTAGISLPNQQATLATVSLTHSHEARSHSSDGSEHGIALVLRSKDREGSSGYEAPLSVGYLYGGGKSETSFSHPSEMKLERTEANQR